MEIIKIISFLILQALAYVAFQTHRTCFFSRTRKSEQVDRAASEAIFSSIPERIPEKQKQCSADINEHHTMLSSFGKRSFKHRREPPRRTPDDDYDDDDEAEYDQAPPTAADIWLIPSHIPKVKSARILWYLDEFVPSHPGIESSTVDGRKKLRAIALEEEKGRKSIRSHPTTPATAKPAPLHVTEVRQQQGIILDPLKVTLDTSSVVDVNPEVDRVKDGPMEGIPQEEYPVQSNLPELNSLNLLEQQTIPVEGDRIPESALNIVPQKAAAIEACAGAYATEPTACVQRLISTPRPLTPTFYHSVAEIVSFPSTPPSSVVEIHPVPSSPLEDMDSQPNCPAPVPIEAEETTAQDITLEDMVTEKTSSQEMIAPEVFQGDIVMGMTVQVEVTQDSGLEDMITEEATPMEMTQALVLEDMVIEEAIPREIIQEKPLETMVTEEVAPAEIIDELTSKDIIMEEATSTEFPQALASEEMVMEDAIPGRTTQETIHENMVTEEDSPAETVPTKPTPTTPSENMGAHQCNEYKPQKLSPLAAWYAKPPHGKEIKRSIVPDHYGERRCSDKERHRIQGDQQSVYPADVSLDRFRAEVRLFPPVRLQLMLNYYVACRIRELDSRSAGIEGNYLERVIRTPEQCRRDYSFDAHWRNYASSRPYDQRQPPFTFHEAIDLVTGCLAAALPEGGQLVRRAEQDFRKELEMEVRQRHEALEEMSWLSSWVCPRRKPPHLAEDPLGQMQKFSRDYARRFLSHLLDEDSLRYYCLGEDVGSDTKKWIQGVRTRSDFISIRHPQTPWCIRRQSDFWMCTKWCHDDMKNCQSFMQFTNTWFKECMAYDSPVPVVKKLYVRFDRDRCDWLKHYAGEFPHREQ